MAGDGVDAMWFLPSALNVKVKEFNQARVNGGNVVLGSGNSGGRVCDGRGNLNMTIDCKFRAYEISCKRIKRQLSIFVAFLAIIQMKLKITQYFMRHFQQSGKEIQPIDTIKVSWHPSMQEGVKWWAISPPHLACKQGVFGVTTKHARRGEMVGNFTSQRMVGHFTSQSIQLARVCWGDNLICKEGEMVGQFTSPSK